MLPEPLHIGLIGKKGCGKSTAASLLLDKLDNNVRWLSFADPLKNAATVIFGLSEEEMSDPELKETPLDRYPFESPRQILQKLGTEAVRSVWPDAWVEAWKQEAEGHDCTITDDVRFLNEAEAVRSLGGILIKIERDGLGSSDDHASERGADELPYDIIVKNTGSQERFGHALMIAILEICEERS